MQRVLVIKNQQLLGAGIENLLRREPGLLVLGVTPQDDGALQQAICSSQADVVVLDDVTIGLTKDKIESNRLLTLLERYPNLRVVVVSADDHLVRIYEARQIIVTQARELAALLKG